MDQQQQQQMGSILDHIKQDEQRISQADVPQDLRDKLLAMMTRLRYLTHDASFFAEYEHTLRYLDWVLNIPFHKTSKDILDLKYAQQVLDKNHFGLKDVKDKILEYMSVLILRHAKGEQGEQLITRAPIILLVGLVGTGKTTIAYSIAEAMGRNVQRIPFGGMAGSAILRGQSRVYPDAEPGWVIKALRRGQASNPVILLDEIDRISEQHIADIMGVLVELLDPEQNKAFTDHYLDYPVNLQNVLFVATSNNTKNISTAVLDRMEVIHMPSYTDEEKAHIAKNYMFPKVMRDSGLSQEDLIIDDAVWNMIIRPLGFDPGIRSLQRHIQDVVRKVARYILEGKLPPNQSFHITAENSKNFLPAW